MSKKYLFEYLTKNQKHATLEIYAETKIGAVIILNLLVKNINHWKSIESDRERTAKP